MIRYVAANHLDKNRILELETLEKRCNVTLYYNECGNLDIPCFHMMQDDDGRIVSYLGIYGIDKDNVEISGATMPEFQRQGLFKRLVQEVKMLLCKAGIEKIHSSLHPDLSYLDFSYEYSEFLLKKKRDLTPQPCVMTMRVQEYDRSTKDELDIYYVIFFIRTPVGLFHITGNRDFACVHNVRIRKSYRGQGYGTTLIRCGLECFFHNHECDVYLHVSGQNKTALRLYKRCGFQVADEVKFYRCL